MTLTLVPPASVLAGTLPVRPFADRFYGLMASDQANARVAALVCNRQHQIVLLSLVGPDGACSSVLARLFDKISLTFHPAEEVAWEGPSLLARVSGEMHRIQAPLAGTRERHMLALARAADLRHILHHPANLPPPPPPPLAEGEATPPPASTVVPPPRTPEPHFVLGNLHESAPARRAFLGHLRGLRIIHTAAWAEHLWERGLAADLIQPLPALGMRAWQLDDDLDRWNGLLTEGARQHWLFANREVVAAQAA